MSNLEHARDAASCRLPKVQIDQSLFCVLDIRALSVLHFFDVLAANNAASTKS
jgi:hypothetical protein